MTPIICFILYDSQSEVLIFYSWNCATAELRYKGCVSNTFVLESSQTGVSGIIQLVRGSLQFLVLALFSLWLLLKQTRPKLSSL